MALTTLDPASALVVVDLQEGLRAAPCIHPLAGVVKQAAALCAAFRQHGLPVVLVNTTGGPPGRTEHSHGTRTYPPDFAELMPELEACPGDRLVTKGTWGAFTGTDLETHLRSAGVTQVVLCGVATSIGVESTARQAHELGFNVLLATDAMTDLTAQAHANSLERIFPRLGESGATQDVIDRVRATR